MKKHLGISFFFGLILIVFCPLSVVSGQGYRPAQERNAYDYFDRVGDKSYYQQQKIDFMKDEMNDYSRRLHSLQEKFNQKFFGLGNKSDFQDPFSEKKIPVTELSNNVQIQEEKVIERHSSPRPLPNYSRSNDSQKLAFEVGVSPVEDSPETFSSDIEVEQESTELDTSFDNTEHSHNGPYFIIRPGITFPYRDQTTHYGANESRHREYEPGLSLTFSGGYHWGGLKLGGGFLYRENKHDRSQSYEVLGGNNYDFISGSKSSTFGGFIELGYDLELAQHFNFYSSLSLGYGVSIVEDYSVALDPNDRTRIDPTFLASLGLGFAFVPTESLSFQLGYRFLYEDEVPAHALELGLNGNF